jgi:hypothetical protein
MSTPRHLSSAPGSAARPGRVFFLEVSEFVCAFDLLDSRIQVGELWAWESRFLAISEVTSNLFSLWVPSDTCPVRRVPPRDPGGFFFSKFPSLYALYICPTHAYKFEFYKNLYFLRSIINIYYVSGHKKDLFN